MKIIYHKDRPAIKFPDERWRPSLRLAINRSAGSDTLSVWLADMEHHQRTPLHWHDTEEVLMFLEVDDAGYARLCTTFGGLKQKVRPNTSQCPHFFFA
jgi:hypothetical protein